MARYTAKEPQIGFAFDSQAGVHALASDRVVPFLTYPNGLAFIPAGCDVYSSSDHGGEYLSVRGVEHIGADAPFGDRVDRQAIALAHAIRRNLLNPAPSDPFYLEELCGALAERALSAPPADIRPEARRLTRNRLKRIEDFIDANLDAPLSVGRMAAELGLSEGAFSRYFRASTGKSPYAHVLDRRIAGARDLLAGTSAGLAHIALAVGFSSHAHMASTFRQRLGCAPSQFRT